MNNHQPETRPLTQPLLTAITAEHTAGYDRLDLQLGPATLIAGPVQAGKTALISLLSLAAENDSRPGGKPRRAGHPESRLLLEFRQQDGATAEIREPKEPAKTATTAGEPEIHCRVRRAGRRKHKDMLPRLKNAGPGAVMKFLRLLNPLPVAVTDVGLRDSAILKGPEIAVTTAEGRRIGWTDMSNGMRAALRLSLELADLPPGHYLLLDSNQLRLPVAGNYGLGLAIARAARHSQVIAVTSAPATVQAIRQALGSENMKIVNCHPADAYGGQRAENGAKPVTSPAETHGPRLLAVPESFLAEVMDCAQRWQELVADHPDRPEAETEADLSAAGNLRQWARAILWAQNAPATTK